MSARVLCGACEEVVYADALAINEHRFGFTWLGDRARWTSAHFGLVHECDPIRRELVYARTGERVANPPWLRWLWRRRGTRRLARLLEGERRFCCQIILEEVSP